MEFFEFARRRYGRHHWTAAEIIKLIIALAIGGIVMFVMGKLNPDMSEETKKKIFEGVVLVLFIIFLFIPTE